MPKFVDAKTLRAAPLAIFLMVGPFACGESISAGTSLTPDAGPPGTFTPDTDGATSSSPDAAAELVTYCASTTCSEPWSTCPTSRFPCDTNLLGDPKNCGACGFACPGSDGSRTYSCVQGSCVLNCYSSSGKWTANCNGIIDDECETLLGTNDNCNACGDSCPDPARPCIFDKNTGKGQCGCDAGKIFCGECVDPKVSDNNCGACGNACNMNGDGGVRPDNTYYGCENAECGHLKCQYPYDDCDKDLETGCEVNLISDENCGACGNACAPGQTCRQRAWDGKIECACPQGQTLCGDFCIDPLTDPRNCGTCGTSCVGVGANGIGICTFGTCDFGCAEGWGDCNSDLSDGCETNLLSDTRNCGACGSSCNLLSGQPCLAGKCAVEPCSGEVETQ